MGRVRERERERGSVCRDREETKMGKSGEKDI